LDAEWFSLYAGKGTGKGGKKRQEQDDFFFFFITLKPRVE